MEHIIELKYENNAITIINDIDNNDIVNFTHSLHVMGFDIYCIIRFIFYKCIY